MSDYMGFGKQSRPGPLRMSTKSFPVVQSHEEMCELCQAIKPRSDMKWFDSDDDGTPLYRCVLSSETAHETAHDKPEHGL